MNFNEHVHIYRTYIIIIVYLFSELIFLKKPTQYKQKFLFKFSFSCKLL